MERSSTTQGLASSRVRAIREGGPMEWWGWLIVIVVVAILVVAAFWLIQRRRRSGGVIVDPSVSPGNSPQEGP